MAAESSIGNSHWRKTIVRYAQQYTLWCNKNNQVAFPPCYLTVAGYLSDFVDANRGSTKSLGNIRSCLSTFCHYVDSPYLTPAEVYKLNAFCASLQFEDVVPVKRMKALGIKVIADIISRMRLQKKSHLLVALCLCLGHNGVLRAGDLLSGFLVEDVLWDHPYKCFTLHLIRSKANRAGGGEHIRICDYDHPFASAYKLLIVWFNRCNL